MSRRLVIFTRFPEPHRVKTRLIPALGADGAAQLHLDMTHHTLQVAHELKRLGLDIEVRFTGGSARRMQDLFGVQFRYVDQGDGDLGQRLIRAFDAHLEPAIAIGTDCPDLSGQQILDGFSALEHYDVVLGPATDGGYYLIGLSRPCRSIFEGIKWGSGCVCSATQQLAELAGLTLKLLPILSDVDEPDDLAIWERAKSNTSSTS